MLGVLELLQSVVIFLLSKQGVTPFSVEVSARSPITILITKLIKSLLTLDKELDRILILPYVIPRMSKAQITLRDVRNSACAWIARKYQPGL
jgi:hypothetical protein